MPSVWRVSAQAPHDLARQLRRSRRRLADLDTGGLQGLLLGERRARRTGHDGARVTHGLALGSGETRDIADDRLGDVLLDVCRGPLLSIPTDLTDNDDHVGLRIVLERLELSLIHISEPTRLGMIS